MKKLFGAVLAAVMVLCLCIPSFASKTAGVEIGEASVNGKAVTLVGVPGENQKPVEEVRAAVKETITQDTLKELENAGLNIDTVALAYEFDLHQVDANGNEIQIPQGTPVTVTMKFDSVPCLVVHQKQDGVYESFVVTKSPDTLTFDGTSPVYILAMPAAAPGATTGPAAGNNAGAGDSVISATPTAPRTGDMTMLYAGVVIMLASAAAVVVYKKKA